MSSCDAFLNVFQSHGLKPEVICPCATSPEAMTVAIRRYVTLYILTAVLMLGKFVQNVDIRIVI